MIPCFCGKHKYHWLDHTNLFELLANMNILQWYYVINSMRHVKENFNSHIKQQCRNKGNTRAETPI